MLVLVSCTDTKSLQAPPRLAMRSYAGRAVVDVAEEWKGALAESPTQCPLQDLYRGGYWKAVRDAQASLGSRGTIAVVSAGIGVATLTDSAPGYAATFAPGHADSVPGAQTRAGAFSWWQALGGPSSLSALASRPDRTGFVVALPQTYLSVVAPELTAHLEAAGDHGIVLGSAPEALRPWSIPLDLRLCSVFGGNAGQITSRALAWLLAKFQDGPLSRTAAATAIAGAIPSNAGAFYPRRSVASDGDVTLWIRSEMARGTQASTSATRALRAWRAAGTACEERRFRNLYAAVVAAWGK